MPKNLQPEGTKGRILEEQVEELDRNQDLAERGLRTTGGEESIELQELGITTDSSVGTLVPDEPDAVHPLDQFHNGQYVLANANVVTAVFGTSSTRTAIP